MLRVQHQVDRRAQAARPLPNVAERGLGPVELANQLAHIAAAEQPTGLVVARSVLLRLRLKIGARTNGLNDLEDCRQEIPSESAFCDEVCCAALRRLLPGNGGIILADD